MVPLRLVGGKSTGLSVATLARRPLGPAIGEVWPRFVMFRDALQRRDDVLRCNITEAFSHPSVYRNGGNVFTSTKEYDREVSSFPVGIIC